MFGDKTAIELSRVGVQRGTRWILRDVTWSVPAGACCAVMGPNGSGKSTLTRVLGAHLYPSTGQCAILGQRFGQANLQALRRSIRLVQPAGPYDVEPTLSARDVVLTGFFGTLALFDAPTAEMEQDSRRLLEQVGLAHVAEQSYATLSSGERVRSLIARALASRPKLLLLDEPTAGLDLLAREQVLATVQGLFDRPAEAPTVVMVTHHVEELPPATSHVLLLSDGAPAAAGSPAEVLRADVLSAVYRCPLEVRNVGGRWSLHVHPDAWRDLLNRPAP
ncbi:MAG TPA: ATP-binding cassette domain-containing protein [Tepidisphaeraceae bacterium]|nr:ATP-binding cassette domain-containing protein [Tepidisphaeraceae bacterium]